MSYARQIAIVLVTLFVFFAALYGWRSLQFQGADPTAPSLDLEDEVFPLQPDAPARLAEYHKVRADFETKNAGKPIDEWPELDRHHYLEMGIKIGIITKQMPSN